MIIDNVYVIIINNYNERYCYINVNVLIFPTAKALYLISSYHADAFTSCCASRLLSATDAHTGSAETESLPNADSIA